MSRLESPAEFARILLSDFESAEKVCNSNSDINLTKHEIIIRRLNTHIGMDRAMIMEIIDDVRAACVHGQNEALKRVGKVALEGDEITSYATHYYEAKARVMILDELLEKIGRE